jgi:hypothetical protein
VWPCYTLQAWRWQTLRQKLKVRKYPVAQVQQVAAIVADGNTCSDLMLDAQRVEYFIKHAQAVSERAYFKEHHVFNDCSAVARVTFKGGRTAEYRLDASGTGILTPIMKRKAAKPLYFYNCDNCSGFLARDFRFE